MYYYLSCAYPQHGGRPAGLKSSWLLFMVSWIPIKTRPPPWDAVLAKKVWERTKKLAISKQLQTHFKAKLEKGLGTSFPRILAPIHLRFPLCTHFDFHCALHQ